MSVKGRFCGGDFASLFGPDGSDGSDGSDGCSCGGLNGGS